MMDLGSGDVVRGSGDGMGSWIQGSGDPETIPETMCSPIPCTVHTMGSVVGIQTTMNTTTIRHIICSGGME